jgi:carboxymethylenebutenolidase
LCHAEADSRDAVRISLAVPGTDTPITSVDVGVADGSFRAFISHPQRMPAPAIVNVPSIFGVTDEAHRWLHDGAAAGFLTLVYDPFWRTDPGPLSPLVDAERARAAARRDATAVEDATADLAAVIAAARAQPACNGRVAVVGYCFGGRYALIAAACLPIDAAVSYHGILIGRSLDVAALIRAPLSLHAGDNDPECPPAEIEAIRAATADNPLVELHVYPGVGHSFTWRGYRKFDAAAAERSEARAFALLDTLKDAPS